MAKLCKCSAFFHLILSSSKKRGEKKAREKKRQRAETEKSSALPRSETFLKWLFGTAVESTFYAVEQHKEINIKQNG